MTMIRHVIKYLLFSLFCVLFPVLVYSQQETKSIPKEWHLLDPEQDQFQGISIERTYNSLLKDQPSKTVVVAVIDSGVDINHEDLMGSIWINEDEIPDNGIDDDNNGYIDDVHGWNFIGGKDGNVNEDTDELTREYVRLKKMFEGVDDNKIPKRQKSEYENYQRTKAKFEKLVEKNTEQYELYNNLYKNVSLSVDTLKTLIGVATLSSSAYYCWR